MVDPAFVEGSISVWPTPASARMCSMLVNHQHTERIVWQMTQQAHSTRENKELG